MPIIRTSGMMDTGDSFDGPGADLFIETLLDAMAAVLEGPVSSATDHELARRSR